MWHLVQQPIRSLFELRHSMPSVETSHFFTVSISVSLFVSLSVFVSAYLSVPVSIPVCLCLCLSLSMYVSVSFSVRVSPSVSVCLCLSMSLSRPLPLSLPLPLSQSVCLSLCRDHDLYSCFACDRYERRSRPTGRRQTHTSATEFGIYTQRRVGLLYAFTFRLADKKTTIASDLILFRFRVYLGSGMTAVETFRMSPRDLVLKSQNKNAFTTNVRIHVS